MDGGMGTMNDTAIMSGGGVDINELISTNKCSPMVVYGIITFLSLYSIYNSKNTASRYNGKYDQLINMYTTHEIKILIIMGASIYGLCTFKEKQLAWIFILILIIYKLLKNIIIYLPIPNVMSNAPINYVASNSSNYGITPQMQQALLQQSVKQNVNKQLDLNSISGGGDNLSNNMAPPLDAGNAGFAKF